MRDVFVYPLLELFFVVDVVMWVGNVMIWNDWWIFYLPQLVWFSAVKTGFQEHVLWCQAMALLMIDLCSMSFHPPCVMKSLAFWYDFRVPHNATRVASPVTPI